MSFEKTDAEGLDGRKVGEAHSDWRYNSEVMRGLMRQENFKKWCETNQVSCIFRGLIPKKYKNVLGEEEITYEVLTHIEFAFKKNETSYVDPLSFHRSVQEFNRKLEMRFFNLMKTK